MSLSNTVEDALLLLESYSLSLADKLWNKLSDTIEKRSMEYLKRYIKTDMKVAAIIFDDKERYVGRVIMVMFYFLLIRFPNLSGLCFCK